jgi:hypothetical protein
MSHTGLGKYSKAEQDLRVIAFSSSKDLSRIILGHFSGSSRGLCYREHTSVPAVGSIQSLTSSASHSRGRIDRRIRIVKLNASN